MRKARLRRTSCIALLCGFLGANPANSTLFRAPNWTAQSETAATAPLRFLQAFSRADDVQRELHPILNRSLDIVAGPADPRPLTEQMGAPQGVAIDSAHRVLVSDSLARVVHVFDFERRQYFAFGDHYDQLRSPGALAVGDQDHVYVTDVTLAAVLVFDTRGKFLRYLGKSGENETYFQSPVSIAIAGGKQRIYVCDSRRHMILVLDKRGQIVGHIGKRAAGSGPGEFRYPSRIAIAGEELIVLDSGNSRLQMLDLDGNFRREIKLQEASLEDGLAVDRDRNLYISDTQLNVLNVFSNDGRFLYKFGQAGNHPGEFSGPRGLFIDAENRLFVADTGNRRVQVFQIEKPH